MARLKPRVAIVDDHVLLWPALSTSLADYGFDVVAQVPAIAELPTLDLDLVICDLHLPRGLSGAAAVADLTHRGVPVLALSGVANQEVVLDAIEAGAIGFVEKTSPASRFTVAVEAAVTDGCHVSAQLAGFLLGDHRRRPLPSGDLSAHQLTVLRELAKGEDLTEVALSLGMSRAHLLDLVRAALDLARERRRRLRLTPLELRTVTLVACDGLSNEGAAAELSISPWTVTSRLERVRDKYQELHPEVSPRMRPRDAARAWAVELDLCRRQVPN
ncbi:response regulator [Pseudofrankia saprophytica]|uniref:response regulator n=1 Tax=Pseudofrankia saprophytica TaxID=298655 RepID=UPI000234B6D6|nr:response regulator transcription factor [Pseudofrankia saprophytica]